MFAEPIPNVTVALGRDVNLPCVIENLGTYKVSYVKIIFTSPRRVFAREKLFNRNL